MCWGRRASSPFESFQRRSLFVKIRSRIMRRTRVTAAGWIAYYYIILKVRSTFNFDIAIIVRRGAAKRNYPSYFLETYTYIYNISITDHPRQALGSKVFFFYNIWTRFELLRPVRLRDSKDSHHRPRPGRIYLFSCYILCTFSTCCTPINIFHQYFICTKCSRIVSKNVRPILFAIVNIL